jgi:hypothetical protein
MFVAYSDVSNCRGRSSAGPHPRQPLKTGALMRPLAISLCVAAAMLVPAASASAQAPYEPNDSYNTAFGPLTAGTTYSAAFETQNDVDYYFFYLPQLTQLRYTLSVPASGPVGDGVYLDIDHQLSDRVDQDVSNELGVEEGQTGTGAISLDRGKYYIRINDQCCSDPTGDAYTLTLNPPGATSTYEPFAQECANAHPAVEQTGAALAAQQAAVAAAEAAVAKAKAKLHAAHSAGASPRKIQRLKAKLAARRAELASAKTTLKAREADYNAAVEAERQACSVPQ